mmetsp:Transcript_30059/g.39559  ORF Transcript_30059/g.39559 Transcript_30059/m.39559 type:complete len:302 (+) Transcript_30059:171-1076(+)
MNNICHRIRKHDVLAPSNINTKVCFARLKSKNFMKPRNFSSVAVNVQNQTHPEENRLREDLAAAYRLSNMYGWGGDIIHNHISVRIPDSETFLMNPFGMLYDQITASSLVKVDLEGNVLEPGTGTGIISPAGFVIHSALHGGRANVHAAMHFHQPSGMAVSALKVGLLPIFQDALLLGNISTHKFEGIAIDEHEKERLVSDLGPENNVMLLDNHGIVTVGETLEEAFVWMYWLDKACQAQVKAMAAVGGDLSKLHIPEDAMKQKCHEQYIRAFDKAGVGVGKLEFAALKKKLNLMDPSYKD